MPQETYQLKIYENRSDSLDRVLTLVNESGFQGVEETDSSHILFFQNKRDAETLLSEIQTRYSDIPVSGIERVLPRDWQLEWKKQFQAFELEPCWKIIPSWQEKKQSEGRIIIQIEPGLGFGTGTHETTQLCLKATAQFSKGCANFLDFGCGSGILSIGAYQFLNVSGVGVENDLDAMENAKRNFALNQIGNEICLAQRIPEKIQFDLVVANIIRSTLIEYCDELSSKVRRVLILSGLLEEDLAEVQSAFCKRLTDFCAPQVLKQGDWRALVWLRT